MARRPIKKTRRVNLTIGPEAAKALDGHRKRLSAERGVEVTESDAVRDAIVRTSAA